MKNLVLRPMQRIEVLNLLFGKIEPERVIHVGRRYHDSGDDPVKYKNISLVKDRHWRISEIESDEPGYSYYFVPNTFSQKCLHKFDHPEILSSPGAYYKKKGRKYYASKDAFVSELNALVLDLDFDKKNNTFDKYYPVLLKDIDEGKIILPSMIALSGSGVYLYWLVNSIEVTPEVIAKRKGSIDALCSLLRPEFGVDRKATALCNWYKLPNTIDTKTWKDVKYSQCSMQGQRMPIYDLSDISKKLGALAPMNGGSNSKQSDNTRDKVSKSQIKQLPDRKRGWCTGHIKGSRGVKSRKNQMLKLLAHRGKINEGCRHHFMFHLFNLLLRCQRYINAGNAGFIKYDAYNNAYTEAQNINLDYFSPPLTEPQMKKACIYWGKVQLPSNAKIVNDLGITTEEADAAGLTTLRPVQPRVTKTSQKEKIIQYYKDCRKQSSKINKTKIAKELSVSREYVSKVINKFETEEAD